VPSGPLKGTRALAAEEDLARRLAVSLDPAQAKQGITSGTAPREILTRMKSRVDPLEDTGIAFSALKEEQQGLLISIIETYAAVQHPEIARYRLRKIRKTGLKDVKFVWMGGLKPGQGHYYRIQGATFLIEYDNTQNGANHVHCVWRDFTGDFGRDVLAEHYRRDHTTR
jgi:hypothetical protein